uniref:Uncharacterized protein n=1 Tax=Dulem virus 208 TaxID=3145685 RepID=A0AAU8B8J9_9VIRU
MKREVNSYKDYDFDLEKYAEEQKKLASLSGIEDEEVYVKPVDTSVSGMVARGIVADNSQLVYGEDLPPLAGASLMDLHKMKKDIAGRISFMESDLKSQKENLKNQEQEKKDDAGAGNEQ